jgi:hypothetical protein
MVNFTSDDILLYINNELSPKQTTAFETALLNDWSLQERYHILLESSEKTKTPLLQPSQRVLNNIMDYANAVVATKETVL